MYIDPNTGGMLFQVLAVMFTVISGVFLAFSGRIRHMLARFKRAQREKNEQSKDANV